MTLMKQFLGSGAIALTAQDFAVLDAYRSLGKRSACAADVFLVLQRELKKDPRIPTVYKVVTKLRDLGLLEDVGESSAPNGGRPRRLFQLTEEGRRALSVADSMAAHSSGATFRSA